MKQQYTRQELADIRELERDEWSLNKFDQIFEEDHTELSLQEELDLLTKNLLSYKLHKDHLEVMRNDRSSSFLYFGNPRNSCLAQLIVNLHKDKEVK